MSVNVFVQNRSQEGLRQLIAKEPPAVVFVQEVSPAWGSMLDMLPAYPYRKIIPRGDAFGIALLSKYPLEDVVVLNEEVFDSPAISATMTWEGKKVALRAVHPQPPLGAERYAERNKMLAHHADALAKFGLPAIMAGDFNATPWSAGLSVVQDAGMVRATSLAPTWPAHLPAPAVIPTDRITESRHWRVLSNASGPDIGSVHSRLRRRSTYLVR